MGILANIDHDIDGCVVINHLIDSGIIGPRTSDNGKTLCNSIDPEHWIIKDGTLHVRGDIGIYDQGKPIDWAGWGINEIVARDYVKINSHNLSGSILPKRIKARSISFEGLFNEFSGINIEAEIYIYLRTPCVGKNPAIHDIHINADALSIVDTPDNVYNLTGQVNRIYLNYSYIYECKWLEQSIRVGTYNGKFIRTGKHLRAVINNPKKYRIDINEVLDAKALVQATGLESLNPRLIRIKDHGVEIDIIKSGKGWMLTASHLAY